ncbi:four helix bundle protein [Niastella koreensis]|uniref:S23 ribosomal protein n=2 Tax=Niastella koreensis TaxID=354356 RepID=G8TH36_NIAKG|nr:four helix bundle protein [Niastella koreensis]AEW00647.1 S23 ribosomal protein [Niastella koreensis GR20-10]OQP42279.1 four helix bundle protein [Niastella koreensis]
MAAFKTFEEIEAWKKSRILCSKIHSLTITTDLARDYKLKDQINGSSGSIMDNIAEGFGRGGNKEFIQFLAISLGSVSESMSQLYRLLDRNYINKPLFTELYSLCNEIKKMILSLINYIKRSTLKGIKFNTNNTNPEP